MFPTTACRTAPAMDSMESSFAMNPFAPTERASSINRLSVKVLNISVAICGKSALMTAAKVTPSMCGI